MIHTPPPPGDTLHLVPLLGRCAHLARWRIEAELAQFDTTAPQTHLLMQLHHLGGTATQSQITAFLRVKPSTVNGLLERLEERGLIARAISPQDARQRIISLTPAGQAMQSALFETLREGETKLQAVFSPQELDTLTGLLNRLLQTLEEEPTP